MQRNVRLAARKTQSSSGAHVSLAAVQAAFNEAVEHFQIGQFSLAEQLGRQVLAIDARHADSLNLLGILACRQGRYAEGADLVARAIKINDTVPFYHVNLGNAYQGQGRLEEATHHYQRALHLNPDYAEAYNNLGNVRRRQGRTADAVRSFQSALALKPDIAEVHYNLGNALIELSRPGEAAVHLQRAANLKPNVPEIHNDLGNALKSEGRFAEAAAQYRQALGLKPDYAEAHNNLGGALLGLGQLVDALQHYHRALALKPGYAEAHNNLGNALKEQGNLEEAAAQYQRALTLRPDYAEPCNNLANILRDQDRLADAVALYRRALALQPRFAEAYSNLGTALTQQGRLDEAVASIEQALKIKPGYVHAYNSLGNAYKAQGNFAAARRAFERAIELAPEIGLYYRVLFDIGRVAPDDPQFAAAEALNRKMASLPMKDQKGLHFALGKAFADQEHYERAFHHLQSGNALQRRSFTYDEHHALGMFERIRNTFTGELMQRRRGAGDPAETPVFIIGMPRSGTTLAEQILASHPHVFGAGERRELPRAVASLRAYGTTLAFPEAVSALSDEALRDFGSSYLAAVAALTPGARRIVDKMPGNFHFAGLINLALPNARIIHMRRDPIDTCLSCFSILFEAGHPYAYDLRELGRYYRAYQGLMAHWRNVLPQGVMLDVQYEDVVADAEGQVRAILAHCGLDWDDRCLAFHRTQRPVHTASAMQVRQPIYRTSIGRWRHYRHLLRPLMAELGPPASGSLTM